jgi:hypothetical protein
LMVTVTRSLVGGLIDWFDWSRLEGNWLLLFFMGRKKAEEGISEEKGRGEEGGGGGDLPGTSIHSSSFFSILLCLLRGLCYL